MPSFMRAHTTLGLTKTAAVNTRTVGSLVNALAPRWARTLTTEGGITFMRIPTALSLPEEAGCFLFSVQCAA